MIKTLRKRHVQVWVFLAIFIPLGIVSSWLVIPKTVTDHILHPAYSNALPILIKTVSKDEYSVSLRRMEDWSEVQLEWINHSALTSPSAIIYETYPEKGTDRLEGAGLIGRIDSRGVYHFPLRKDSLRVHFHFILYDIIHHQIIDRINF